MSVNKNGERAVKQALHRSARVSSLMSTILVLLIFIGARFEILQIAAREGFGLLLFPLVVIIGFGVAWWHEGLGGGISTISLLGFYIVYGLLMRGNINQGWGFIVFASPGLLFLLSWLCSRSRNSALLQT